MEKDRYRYTIPSLDSPALKLLLALTITGKEGEKAKIFGEDYNTKNFDDFFIYE